MPGYLLTMSAVITCSHGGKVNLTAPNPRVKIMGQPVPLSVPPFAVAGCSFPPPPVANGPCATGTWLPPTCTLRVKSMGLPLVVQTSQANCVPTGTPVVIAFPGQMRVKAF